MYVFLFIQMPASTPQDRTLIAHHDILIDRLSVDPVNYADFLLAAGFISSNDHSKVLSPSLTPKEKAVVLLSAVREQVKRNPSRIHDFLQVLLRDVSNIGVVKAVVKQLESEGQSLCRVY